MEAAEDGALKIDTRGKILIAMGTTSTQKKIPCFNPSSLSIGCWVNNVKKDSNGSIFLDIKPGRFEVSKISLQYCMPKIFKIH